MDTLDEKARAEFEAHFRETHRYHEPERLGDGYICPRENAYYEGWLAVHRTASTAAQTEAVARQIEYIRRQGQSYLTWQAAGFPVADAHDTFPNDLYDAAVRPEALLPLLDALTHPASPASASPERDFAMLRFPEVYGSPASASTEGAADQLKRLAKSLNEAAFAAGRADMDDSSTANRSKRFQAERQRRMQRLLDAIDRAPSGKLPASRVEGEMPALPNPDGHDDNWAMLPWVFMSTLAQYGKDCFEVGLKKGNTP